jgi:hypothetical protein
MFEIYSTYVVPVTVLIPIFFAIKNYRYLSAPMVTILHFLLFSGIANLVNLVSISLHYSSIGIFHIYTVFEFLFISLFYLNFYNRRGKKYFWLVIGTFTTLSVANSMFVQNTLYNTYAHSAQTVIFLVYSMLFVSNQTNTNENMNWSDNKYNWVNTGILIYYASGLLMFASINYMLKASLALSNIVWTIHDTILMLEYVLFAIGFYKCRPQTTTSIS